MHERGEPNAAERGHPCLQSAQTRALVLFREAFALSVIVAQFKRAIEETFQVQTFANGLTGFSRLAVFDEVAASKFFRRQPNGPGNFVHVALQREDALRRAKSPESPVWRDVGRDRLALDANVRTEVRPGGVNRAAREHYRRQC